MGLGTEDSFSRRCNRRGLFELPQIVSLGVHSAPSQVKASLAQFMRNEFCIVRAVLDNQPVQRLPGRTWALSANHGTRSSSLR